MLESVTLCPEQVSSVIYDKLRREGQLSRLIATLKYCSTNGYDLENTYKSICAGFPYYFDKEFTQEVLVDMIKERVDLSVAWGFGEDGDKIGDIILKDKAFDLAMKTKSLEDIRLYREMYNPESLPENAEKQGTVVNFNISKT